MYADGPQPVEMCPEGICHLNNQNSFHNPSDVTSILKILLIFISFYLRVEIFSFYDVPFYVLDIFFLIFSCNLIMRSFVWSVDMI